jgi:hypothetical protein
VLESMGSDVYVYFTLGRDQGVASAELEELAQDSGRADTGASGDTVVARLDAATRIHEGEDAELWVDGRSMHVFDPATGRNLSLAAGGGADGGALRAVPTSPATGQATAGTGSTQPVSGGAGSTEEVT